LAQQTDKSVKPVFIYKMIQLPKLKSLSSKLKLLNYSVKRPFLPFSSQSYYLQLHNIMSRQKKAHYASGLSVATYYALSSS
jgi:hypothetical protein